jgi:hypothetical protein
MRDMSTPLALALSSALSNVSDGGVDVDAARDQLFGGAQPLRDRRQLDRHVGRDRRQCPRVLEHARRAAVELRVHLHRQEALLAGRALVDGLEDRGRSAADRLDEPPGDVVLGRLRVRRDQLVEHRLPSLRVLLHDREDDLRVRRRADGAVVDGLLQLRDRAGVVPEVGALLGGQAHAGEQRGLGHF